MTTLTSHRPGATHWVVAGVLALVLAGCGSDDADSDEPAENEATDAAGAAAEVALREDDGFVFDPTEVTVTAGDTVTWVHEGQVSHTVTAEDDSFDSGTLAAGDTFETTFDEPGSYPYVCGFHGSMRGTVTVE